MRNKNNNHGYEDFFGSQNKNLKINMLHFV